MNIFVLCKDDPVKSAQFQCDKHVVNQPRECTQMLSTGIYLLDLDLQNRYPLQALRKRNPEGEVLRVKFKDETGLYLPTHEHHPCTKWTIASSYNFAWHVIHAKALCTEYTERYKREHACLSIIRHCAKIGEGLSFPLNILTSYAQALPDHFKHDNVEVAYRSYYLSDKYEIATWKRNKPTWWVDSWEEENELSTST